MKRFRIGGAFRRQPATAAVLLGIAVLVIAACAGGGHRALEASQLGQLIPESALPQGFEEFGRGQALVGGAQASTAPSLDVDFRDAQGNRIDFVLVAEGDESGAREVFESFVQSQERALYSLLNQPEPSAEPLPTYECNRQAGPPPAEGACAYVEEPALDLGTEARAFASAAPIQGMDISSDIFIRDSVMAEIVVYAIPGSDFAGDRERLALELDSRIRTVLESGSVD